MPPPPHTCAPYVLYLPDASETQCRPPRSIGSHPATLARWCTGMPRRVSALMPDPCTLSWDALYCSFCVRCGQRYGPLRNCCGRTWAAIRRGDFGPYSDYSGHEQETFRVSRRLVLRAPTPEEAEWEQQVWALLARVEDACWRREGGWREPRERGDEWSERSELGERGLSETGEIGDETAAPEAGDEATECPHHGALTDDADGSTGVPELLPSAPSGHVGGACASPEDSLDDHLQLAEGRAALARLERCLATGRDEAGAKLSPALRTDMLRERRALRSELAVCAWALTGAWAPEPGLEGYESDERDEGEDDDESVRTPLSLDAPGGAGTEWA